MSGLYEKNLRNKPFIRLICNLCNASQENKCHVPGSMGVFTTLRSKDTNGKCTRIGYEDFCLLEYNAIQSIPFKPTIILEQYVISYLKVEK
jgi:hypothetical protein